MVKPPKLTGGNVGSRFTATAAINLKDTGSQEPDISSLLTDVRDLICTAKSRAATAVNVELVLLCLAYRRPNP